MTYGILSHPRLDPLSEGSAGEPSLEQHGLGVLVQSYIHLSKKSLSFVGRRDKRHD
jgi:hypothetical protein